MSFLTLAALCALTETGERQVPCPACATLSCDGWEAEPGGFDASRLELVGSLLDPNADEHVVDEFHPDGTNLWSVDAPVAPAYFPYNRCSVWRCSVCTRAYLRYTEYGGYYQEARIRALRSAVLPTRAEGP